ncbi:hypothetical protein N9A49_04975 [Salibacteraceae bacterium]|nr:hypothetical protein [Salibacteraceae bacterium]
MGLKELRNWSWLSVACICLLTACQDPEEKYLEQFGIFLNDTELHLEEYSDSEWAEVEYAYQFFVNEEYDKHESMLSESEKKQVQLYKERFKKLEVKRDPIDNLLKVIGL